MMNQEKTELIKDMLKKFTDDFSSVDVEFIADLDYPHTIEIITACVDEEDNISTRTVDDLEDLVELFKKFPVGIDYTVKIPSLTGVMTLKSRSGE